GRRLSHLAVRYDGLLRVRSSEVFGEALAAGIGSAKGFGFGLLSLAPAALASLD
ncbi:MAG: type I-E CRISPR-associated protein Cas6/Cse3/CasE, partial [Enterococcus lemanii]